MGYMKDQDLAIAERLLAMFESLTVAWECGDLTGAEMYEALCNNIKHDHLGVRQVLERTSKDD